MAGTPTTENRTLSMYPEEWAIAEREAERLGSKRNISAAVRRILREWKYFDDLRTKATPPPEVWMDPVREADFCAT